MEKCHSQQQLLTPRYRERRSSRHTGAEKNEAQLAAPTCREGPIFEAADFPRLDSKSTKPKTPRRERPQPAVVQQQPPVQDVVAHNIDDQAPAASAPPAVVTQETDSRSTNPKTPRRENPQPAVVQQQPPVQDVVARNIDDQAPAASAPPAVFTQETEHASGSGNFTSMMDSLMKAAEQVRASNFRNGSYVSAFLKEFSSTVQDMKQSQPRLPPGATEDDTAALLALNLILDASRSREDKLQQNDLTPFEESQTLQKSISESYLPTPCRSNRVRFSEAIPPPLANASLNVQTPPLAYMRNAPVWFHAPLAQFPPAPYTVVYPVGSLPTSQFRGVSTEPAPPAKKADYTVVNPRTGERLTVSSVVPFSCRSSQRLKIVNPKTGEEVMPAGTETTDCPQPDVSPSATSGRHNMVGGGVREGSSWALVPTSGDFWDWPLSRQEKKDRFLLLTQLQMASEIEELECRLEEMESKN